MELSSDEKRLVRGAINGSILVLDAATGGHLVTRRSISRADDTGESDWVTNTPGGYFISTPGAGPCVFIPDPGELRHPMSREGEPEGGW